MPKISQKGLAMPASPIRKLVPFATEAKSKGIKVYHLNIGQPDIPTPEVAIQAVKNFNYDTLAYLNSEGSLNYREALSQYYYKLNLPIEAKHIIETTGGSEALLFGFLATMDSGDEVIIPEPFYANYNSFARTGDIKILPITSKIDNGFSLPAIADFEAKITPKTKAILICNPNNPTGYLYAKSELDQLKDIVLKHDLFLFADEVYREFCYDGQTHTSILSYPELHNHAIVIDSTSKRYSACGARLGALVTRNQEILDTVLKFAQARLSSPTLSEILALGALDTPDSYFQEVIQDYDSRRNLLVKRLNEIPGIVCPMPKGAFYAMAQLPVHDAEDFCKWMLSDFSYEGATVMMAPASGFYATQGLGKNEVRIAYVLKTEELDKAMTCLAKGLEAYPKKI
ncbi:MAG: pyridoxal phosphate-dependent aminotransferase [Chitinophagales bacterium]|nr:pyridoxal phosphate-dependent aminotransferase [Chitinophagales bacterium]